MSSSKGFCEDGKSEPSDTIPVAANDSGEEDEFRECPEDLSEFTVVDEAEFSEPENEENDLDSEDQEKESDDSEDEDYELLIPPNYSDNNEEETEQWDCPAERKGPRTYREKDFHPKIPDPRCKTDWPLAVFWPVYVGNFRLFARRDAHCVRRIHRYFASKGIPAFMVFRLKDKFFKDYQSHTGLYDMLVYFCCEEDANLAIRKCNRKFYYGHRLHVYSGRTPEYYSANGKQWGDKSKTWHFKHLDEKYRLEPLTAIQEGLDKYGVSSCITKISSDEVLVQFRELKDEADFAGETSFKVERMNTPTMKQRFLEQNVEDRLRQIMRTNGRFMAQRPKHEWLNPIMHGVIPEDDWPWVQPHQPKSQHIAMLAPKPENREVGKLPFYLTQFGSDTSDSEDEVAEQWDCPPERKGPRTYRERDFQPTVPDPRCRKGWPLAAFWPVYVGNFWLNKRDPSDRDLERAVHQYFASWGLPAFMVYRLKDQFYNDYQVHTGFYDMLVYFCCEKDANRAMQWCHNDRFYGQKLQVSSGRTPTYFPVNPSQWKAESKSWNFKFLEASDRMKTLAVLEEKLGSYDKIRFISRNSFDEVLVLFMNPLTDAAFAGETRFKVEAIDTPMMKQRFVEQDVEDLLREEIATNPGIMASRPTPNLLTSIMHGVIPKMNKPWQKTRINPHNAIQKNAVISTTKKRKPALQRQGQLDSNNMQPSPDDDLEHERFLKQKLSQLYARRRMRGANTSGASQQYAPRTARHHTVEEIDWEFEKERKRRRFQSQFDSSFNSDFFN